MWMRPPWRRTMRWQSDSPSPVPSPASRVEKKGWKSRSMCSGLMPTPASSTATTAPPPARRRPPLPAPPPRVARGEEGLEEPLHVLGLDAHARVLDGHHGVLAVAAGAHLDA